MVAISKILQKVKTFFKPAKNNVLAHIYPYYCNLVIAICISHGSTIDKLVKLLRGRAHRANHGEFLWRSKLAQRVETMNKLGRVKVVFLKRRGNRSLSNDKLAEV